jgi:hypothetical protein
MRIGKVGNTTFHFSILWTIILSLGVFILTSGLRGCSSDNTDTDAFVEQESDRLAAQFIDHFSHHSDY